MLKGGGMPPLTLPQLVSQSLLIPVFLCGEQHAHVHNCTMAFSLPLPLSLSFHLRLPFIHSRFRRRSAQLAFPQTSTHKGSESVLPFLLTRWVCKRIREANANPNRKQVEKAVGQLRTDELREEGEFREATPPSFLPLPHST